MSEMIKVPVKARFVYDRKTGELLSKEFTYRECTHEDFINAMARLLLPGAEIIAGRPAVRR